jgi:cobalt-zinc-cadmium efflux system outer membrane protein
MAPRLWLHALLPVSLTLAGCASLPPDRGAGQVQELTAARGQPWPRPSAQERERTVAALLAGPLTLRGATTIALLNNPRVSAVYAHLGIAGAEVLEAGRLSNPVLSATLGFTGASGAVDRYSFGLTQDFLDLLMLPARKRLARADFNRAQLEAGSAILELAGDVQRAYYHCIAAQQIAAMRGAAADAADASAELAQRLFAAGNIDQLQLSLRQAEAAQAQLERIDTETSRDLARSELNRFLGLSAPVRWTLSANLPLPVAQEDSVDALQSLAAQKRLDLQVARTRLAALEDRLGATRSTRLLDKGEIGVAHERDTDGRHITGPELALGLPLFNQGQGRVLAAQAALEQAHAETDALHLDVSNDVSAANARVAATRARIDTLRTRLLPLREAVVARTQEHVNYMLLGTFDLLLARQQQYDAYQRYIEAVRDYWLARTDLARAVGTQLPSDAQIGTDTLDPGEILPEPAHDTPPSVAPAANATGTAPPPQHSHGD